MIADYLHSRSLGDRRRDAVLYALQREKHLWLSGIEAMPPSVAKGVLIGVPIGLVLWAWLIWLAVRWL